MITKEFTMHAEESENLIALSSLPIKTFWTSNYDKFLENALKKMNKLIDVKISSSSLASTVPNRDAVVYKMHGDCEDPGSCVLTKEDYEVYNKY